MRAPLAATLAIVLTFGCTDQPLTPSALSDGAAPAPAFNFLNNPDPGNNRIFRYEADLFLLIFQFPTSIPPAGTPDLVAVHTTTPDCGGILEPADFQEIVDPDDPIFNQIRQVVQADPINIFIVDLAQAGSCFGFELVASGTGKLVNTDNDVLVFLRENNNANAFGFTAQGTLYGPGGERAHYSGVSKASWDGNTGDRFFINEHFNFRWLGN